MSTWFTPTVKTDDPDKQDNWPEGKEIGPVLCYNGSSELVALLQGRYDHTKIDDHMINRVDTLFDKLEKDTASKTSPAIKQKFVKWLKEHKGKRLFFLHQ